MLVRTSKSKRVKEIFWEISSVKPYVIRIPKSEASLIIRTIRLESSEKIPPLKIREVKARESSGYNLASNFRISSRSERGETQELKSLLEDLKKRVEKLESEFKELKNIVIPLSEISLEISINEMNKIKEGVLKLVKENPGILTSEILEKFDEYEPLIVLKALDELEKEGKVKGKNVGSKI